MADTPIELAKKAARAHTNLNVFNLLVSILECRSIHGPQSERDAERIIRICKQATYREVAVYDRALGGIDPGGLPLRRKPRASARKRAVAPSTNSSRTANGS